MRKHKTLAALTAFTLFLGQLTEVSGQQKFALTIDNIMRGPGLYGYEPTGVRWTGARANCGASRGCGAESDLRWGRSRSGWGWPE